MGRDEETGFRSNKETGQFFLFSLFDHMPFLRPDLPPP